MVEAAIHQVCTAALQDYISSPWRWPRESDLIVDLVTGLRGALPPVEVNSTLALAPNLVDIGSLTPRTAPRVRTEVKIGAAHQPPSEDTSEVADAEQGPAARERQVHDERIDIGVFHADRTASTTIHGNGARDVVLETSLRDFAALIEVKVYPDTYVHHGRCQWFMDIEKLLKIGGCTRGVLMVDTALPLSTIGVVVKKARGVPLHRTAGVLPPWPLRLGTFRVQGLEFTPSTAPQAGGLFLWALAVRSASSWLPTFHPPTRTMPTLPVADVEPCCWEVSRVP